MKTYKYAILAHALLVAYVLIIGIMQIFKWQYPKTGLILTVIVLFVFCVGMVVPFFVKKFSVKSIGFYLIHLSIILFLSGMFTYFCSGKIYNVYSTKSVINSELFEYDFNSDGSVKIDEHGNYVYKKRQSVPFSYVLKDMSVEYYSSKAYILKQTEINGRYSYETIKEDIYPSNGYYDFGGYGEIDCDDVDGKIEKSIGFLDVTLKSADSKTKIIARFMYPQVKKYNGKLVFSKNGNLTEKSIKVNYPVNYCGWKIMLVSFNEESNIAVLKFKYNKGEYLTSVGLVLTILSTFYVCLIQPVIKKQKGVKTDANIR